MQGLKRNTFPKEEHLCGRISIDNLYLSGKALFSYPLRIIYKQIEPALDQSDVRVRVLVNAPKKRFKHAVDRNRVKRQLREAYRKNKHALWEIAEKQGINLHIAINYVGDKVEKSAFVEKKMKVALEKLQKEIAQ